LIFFQIPTFILFLNDHSGVFMKLYGGIEAGGTKIVCMIASGPQKILAETSFPTTTPDETIARMIIFFRQHMKEFELEGLGVGSFGPLDLNPGSRTHGYITTTPKPGWRNVDLLGQLRNALNLRVAIDTDVNAAALGEYMWGNGQGMDPFVYYTIGTGIGMGCRMNNFLMHGLTHPEGGHMLLHRNPLDSYDGCCPYHKDCFESLASGPSLEKRWGQKGETLPVDHPAWELEAYYIAQALANTILMLSPRRIVLGGGVMHQKQLFPMIRKNVVEMLNGYVQSSTILTNHIEDYIVPAKLGNHAGVLGSVALAVHA
jgi:fructokinase